MKTNLFITGLLLLQTLLFGQVLVNDDFENETLNALPTGYVVQHDGTGTANQKVVNTVVKNGLQSFQLEGAGGWAADIYKSVAFPNLVTVETWINVDLAANGISAGIGIGNNFVGDWGTRVSRIEFCESGNIYMTSYYNAYGPRYLLSVPYDTKKWYHIRLDHNLTTRKVKVFINGEQVTGVLNDQTFSEFNLQETITPLQIQLLAGNAGTARAMFDDVKVYQTDGLATAETAKDKILIYLSENQEELFVENISTPLSYTLYDGGGNFVKSGYLIRNSISVSPLKPGVYLLTGTDKNGKDFSKKFLKRK
jgi:hypothetical protein